MSLELVELASRAAAGAATLIREARSGPVTVADTKSSAVDVVTETDRASEAHIRSVLLAERPHDTITGEEEATTVGTSGVRWIVDPIDGTVNFLYGLGRYSVSIAVEQDGETVAGVVLDVGRSPDEAVEYRGWRDDAGHHATRDGRPIHVNRPASLEQMLVATGFSYEQQRRVAQGKAVAAMLAEVRDIRRLGSCALDLCLVADGSLDAYVEEGVNEWDYAAGALIAAAAGARVSFGVGAAGGTAIVAAPASCAATFDALVRRCGFLTDAAETLRE